VGVATSKWGPSSLLPNHPCLLWPNGWMDQGGTWHRGGLWSRPHCARWGPSSLPPQKVAQLRPNFRPISIVAKWLDASRCHLVVGTEVGLDPAHIVLDGDPALPKKGHSPQFSAHVYCGQTAGWINIALGRHGDRPQPRRHCVRWSPAPSLNMNV